MLDKFEYQVREVSCQHGRGFLRNSSDEDRYFKVQGKLGWELVSVVSTAPTLTYDSTLYYWKKKMLHETDIQTINFFFRCSKLVLIYIKEKFF